MSTSLIKSSHLLNNNQTSITSLGSYIVRLSGDYAAFLGKDKHKPISLVK
jgi:hypothetical protein